MDVLTRQGKAGEEQRNFPSFIVLLAEVVTQIKGVPSHLNIWIKYPCYGASRFGSIECVFLSQDLDQMHAVFLPQGLDHKFPSIPDTVELTTENGHPMG